MQNEYFFDLKNNFTSQNIGVALDQLVKPSPYVVVVCIGSDITIGDSLGPLVGTLLEKRKIKNIFLYGTLRSTVTAKEVISLSNHIKKFHPYSPIIAVDAAVGDEKEVGQIKLQNRGLFPGIGVGKKMGCIGDVSIMGIVARRSKKPYQELQTTRLSLIYKQAITIADGITGFLEGRSHNQSSSFVHTL